MKRSKILLFVCLFLLTGCGRLNDMNEIATTPAPVVVGQGQTAPGERPESGREDETEPELQIGEIVIDYEPETGKSEGNLYFCICGRNSQHG